MYVLSEQLLWPWKSFQPYKELKCETREARSLILDAGWQKVKGKFNHSVCTCLLCWGHTYSDASLQQKLYLQYIIYLQLG